MVTVGELKAALQKCNDADVIVLASDAEGNSYSLLSTDFSVMAYDPEEGEVYLRELTPELENQGYSEDDLYDGDDAVPCIVLWPV